MKRRSQLPKKFIVQLSVFPINVCISPEATSAWIIEINCRFAISTQKVILSVSLHLPFRTCTMGRTELHGGKD